MPLNNCFNLGVFYLYKNKLLWCSIFILNFVLKYLQDLCDLKMLSIFLQTEFECILVRGHEDYYVRT